MQDTIVNVIHLLATSVWIGGMFFIHFVLQPSIKAIDPPQAGALMGGIAKRFSISAWISIIALIVTGLIKTPGDMLFDTSTDFGAALTVKHILILAAVAVGLVIAFVVGPAMRRNPPKPGAPPPEAFVRAQARLKALSTTNLLLGLAIVVCASLLW
jgi:uncharacterized membrane protein